MPIIDQSIFGSLEAGTSYWQLSFKDFWSNQMFNLQLAKDFAATSQGAIKLEKYVLDADPNMPNKTGHAISRQSPSSAWKTANEKCPALKNVYEAGSTIFPTGGASNLAFSIVQFSLLLADHLGARLGAVQVAVSNLLDDRSFTPYQRIVN